MTTHLPHRRTWAALAGLALVMSFARSEPAGQTQPQFGGAYAALDARRQQLVNDWVSRFGDVTGQKLPPDALYDDVISLSTKTTFDAITHVWQVGSIDLTWSAGTGYRADRLSSSWRYAFQIVAMVCVP